MAKEFTVAFKVRVSDEERLRQGGGHLLICNGSTLAEAEAMDLTALIREVILQGEAPLDYGFEIIDSWG